MLVDAGPVTTATSNRGVSHFGLRSVTRLVALWLVAVVVGGGLVTTPARADTPPVPSPVATSDTAPAVVAQVSPVSPRGDVVNVRGVPVRGVRVSKNGRVVSARVLWNQAMIALPGHRDRFNIRLVAFPVGNGADAIVLASRSRTKVRAKVQQVRITLSKSAARRLVSAGDAVLTVSQQYASPNAKRFARAYVTVTHLNAATGRSAAVSNAGQLASRAASSRAGANCWTRLIRGGADLAGCDLAGAMLADCVLTRADVSGADLSAALLRGCAIGGANMARANVTGVTSGGLSGTPTTLPDGWYIVNGFLTPINPNPPPGLLAQTITFGSSAPGSAKVGWVTYLPAATATSGLPVVFTTTGVASVCEITGGGIVYFTTDGSCVVYANQAGNSNYSSAPEQVQSFTVAVSPGSCAAGGLCTLDDTGPGGGKVFYAPPTPQAWGWNMEAAPNTWSSGSADPFLEWGVDLSGASGVNCANLNVTGSVGTAIGTGLANSAAITTACPMSSAGTPAPAAPAAWAVKNYTGGGKSDWFLPSKGELNVLDISGVGGLAASVGYWSSSQSSASGAWVQVVGAGGGPGFQFTGTKFSPNPVRPVRAF